MLSIEQSHLYREIHEQPAVLEAMLAEETAPIRQLAAQIQQREINYVLIAARGTSDNAGVMQIICWARTTGCRLRWRRQASIRSISDHRA